jgi:hypothetical protein
MKITFDSNVWQIVVSPDRYPEDQAISSFKEINSHIRSGHLLGFLAEPIFTLEAIKKVDRRDFFQKFSPPFTFQENIQANIVNLSMSIESDQSSHPGNNTYLTTYLIEALQLGFKVLRCPRNSWIKNPDLKDEWFIALAELDKSPYLEDFAHLVSKIKERGCGSYDLEEIGKRYASDNEHWTEGMKKAPVLEDRAIVKAFAEWADGDAIAAHIANKNQYFCTRDVARGAGQVSVLSMQNRNWLEAEYGATFVTPEQLAKLLSS